MITFGQYEQDNDTTNGKEPIEWRVLDMNNDGQILIISDKVIDGKPYNTTYISITWENSTIRSWLNGYVASYNTVGTDFTSDNFIDAAFTAEEQTKIVASTVPAHANPTSSTPQGNATTDKIFLLSIVEARDYFRNNAARKADATRYAEQFVVVRGSDSDDPYRPSASEPKPRCRDAYNDYCYAPYYLRTMDHIGSTYPGNAAAAVSSNGIIGYNSVAPDSSSSNGIRPALWVNF